MKIGPYTINKHDDLNLVLTKTVEKTIKSQQVADKMNQKDLGHLPEEHSLRPWQVGDKYEKEELVGYYPKLDMALKRILDDKILDKIDELDVINIKNFISLERNKITEAVRKAHWSLKELV